MEDDLDISDILGTSQHDSDEEELTAAQVLGKLEDVSIVGKPTVQDFT